MPTLSTRRSSRRGLATLALAASGALALGACGSDNNTPNAGGAVTSAAGVATSAAGAGAGAATSAAGAATSAATGGGGGGAVACGDAKGTVDVAGSSAQANAVDAWQKAFSAACGGAGINYNANGSGSGRTAFFQGTVAFAGSDSSLKDADRPLAEKRCAGNPVLDLPMVVGPIAVAYNLSGVDKLVLDAPTIAKLFSDKIKSWDDPAIKKLNPDVSLPATPVQSIHRSDDSGTTENFEKYLTAAAPTDWTFGTAQTWMAPGGTGAPKSAGVASAVKGGDGAIGYVEQSFAENSGLSVAAISTGAGAPVTLSADSASKAVAAATQSGTGNDLALKLDYATKADGAYPIILVTYEIVCSKGLPAAQAATVKSFLTYTSSQGQALLADQKYAPLPDTIRTKVAAAVASLS